MTTTVLTARGSSAGAGTAPRWRVQVLGGFSVTGRRGPVQLPESTWRLVGLLAVTLHPLPRTRVAWTIWGDKDEAHAQGSLRSALWRLGKATPGLIRTEGRDLRLSDDVHVDLAELQQVASAMEHGQDLDPQSIDPLLCCAELLPDWYDAFVDEQRELVRQMRLRTLESLARRLREQQEWASAMRLALTAVTQAPLRETTHQVVLEIHLAEGNVSEAVRHYRALRDALWRELGVTPCERLQATIAPFAR